MYYAIAPIVGVLFTVMNSVNSRFAVSVGNLPSVVVVHVVGLAAVSLLLAAKPERKGIDRPPFHWYAGGFVGVGTVLAGNVAYGRLGVSLAAALALFAQTVFSVAADATGFLGRKKYPLSARSVPGLVLSAAGIVVIAGWKLHDAAYVPFALLAGALPALSFMLNSRLAERIGVFRSVRANYVVGLSTALSAAALVAIAAEFSRSAGAGTAEAIIGSYISGFPAALAAAGPALVLGGGLMGVLAIGAINVFFPKIPALHAAVLMFAGQAVAGVAIDSAVLGRIDVRKLVGVAVVLAGLTIHSAGEKGHR